ncbi:MAG: hypothetical protein KJ548_01965 [Actinobacteria bacterium]|nr:hypothetical protein [Actinomycetota bacterium]MCG2798739.1 hypothetical protein [Cellulomonas sp.]
MHIQSNGPDVESDATTMAVMIGVFDRSRAGQVATVDVVGASGIARGNLERARVELDMYRRDHLDPVPLRRVRRLVMRASHVLTFRLAAAIDALIQAMEHVALAQRHQLQYADRLNASMRALAVGTDQALQDAVEDLRRAGAGERSDELLSELDLLRDRVDALERRSADEA